MYFGLSLTQLVINLISHAQSRAYKRMGACNNLRAWVEHYPVALTDARYAATIIQLHILYHFMTDSLLQYMYMYICTW